MANNEQADRRAVQEQAGLAAYYLVRLSDAKTVAERRLVLGGITNAVETARLLSLRFIGPNQVVYPDEQS